MITVHCGLHKTGTSSIQLALSRMGDRRTQVDLPQPGQGQGFETWASRLRALGPDAILSDENLLGSPFDGYAIAQTRVELLRDVLGGREFQIVVYLRPQPDWLHSVFLQGVQQGELRSPAQFLEACLESDVLNWSTLLELLASTGARRVIPRAYVRGRDVVADFASVVDLGELSGAAGKFRENASIRPDQVPLLQELNRRTEGARHVEFRSAFQGVLTAPRGKQTSAFPLSLQRELLDRYYEDWKSVTAFVSEQEDPTEAAVFSSLLDSWQDQAAAYAGSDLSSPSVQDTAIETILKLMDQVASPPSLRTIAMSAARRTFRRLRGR